MNTLQIILIAITALLGYPIGRFIASNTKEELKAGRIWFRLIMMVCVIGIIPSLILFGKEESFILLSSLVFIFLLAFSALTNKKKNNKRKR